MADSLSTKEIDNISFGKKNYDVPGAVQRMRGETFASFSARQAASHAKKARAKPSRRKSKEAVEAYRQAFPETTEVYQKAVRKSRPPTARRLAEEKAADRIDGSDRDDTGLSSDF